MNNEQNQVVVLVTAPDQDIGNKIAQALVEERLAACVNILPGIVSYYRWEGKIQTDQEVQLFIKTREDLVEDKIIHLVRDLHPYDLPEIITLPVIGGSEPYLDWILAETGA